MPSNKVYSIAIDPDGIKWIGTENGAAKLKATDWNVYNTSNSPLPQNYIQSIAIDDSNNIWFGVGGLGGLAKFDGINWNVYPTAGNVLSIAIDKNYNKWIGILYGGLVKFDGINWQVYNQSNSGLVCSSANTICIDANGTKWLGVVTSGVKGGVVCGALEKFDDLNWTIFDTTNSEIPSNYISSIAIDEFGNKWIGTFNNGLAVYREDGIVFIEENENNIPTYFLLSQNYPNPFNPTTKIKFQIPETGFVSLKVYNLLGREVATLINEEKPKGHYEVELNGSGLSSGIYFYSLKAGEFSETRKMILLQ